MNATSSRLLLSVIYTCIFSILLTSISCDNQVEGPDQRFVTWEGIGPDKWASVWLIHRHIDPKARIDFLTTGSKVSEGIAFDIPDADFRRTSRISTFESLVQGYEIKDERLIQISKIIHDIEVNAWGGKIVEESTYVEDAYRQLQFDYGRENVAFGCYIELFDNLYQLLSTDNSSIKITTKLSPSPSCQELKQPQKASSRRLVEQIEIKQLLEIMRAGKRITFVDTRESEEYKESHIPGAINMKLREVNASVLQNFKGSDLIVAYCVKDFRGFEVARALKNVGLENVAIMQPFGISGWRKLKLPVAGTKALTEAQAIERLNQCIGSPDLCIKGG